MPCYHPIKAYQSKIANENGKFPIFFSPSVKCDAYEQIQLPCGQCIGCRLERSRIWAMRCVCEKEMHESSSFITLTYNPDQTIERQTTLVPADYVNFMKRFRERIYPEKIRFFHCGEYGEQNSRPHHHAIIFGWDFPDKDVFTIQNGSYIYRSSFLEELWPYGFSSIGDVTFESCAYVARYIMKKQTGEKADEYYKGKVPEYVTMSRRPGIGKSFFEKYSADIYPGDQLVIRSDQICKPPRYFDELYKSNHGEEFEIIKQKRKEERSEKDRSDFILRNERRRLCVETSLERCNGDSGLAEKWRSERPEMITDNERKEQCKLAVLKQLKRGFEDGSSDF